ncbi:hypothetical protein CIB48_g10931 [Xylaria polymorpha]|nr:hypothetical protein CIB48_g10931 [Xylaria polymorpha]
MTSHQSQYPIHIVSFDSNKDAKKIDGQHQCQTCFEQFSTRADLRAHVAAFRLEMQQLLARQLEVEAHLPRLNSEDNESDEDEDYDEDDDEDNDNYDYDKRGDLTTSRSNAPVSIAPTAVPAIPNYMSGSVTPSDALCNPEISFPFSPPSFTPGGVFAPIFYGNTIPPYYHTQQSQMLPFYADTPQRNYSQTIQLDVPSHGISPGLGTENQARVGQSGDATGSASN